MPSFAAASVSNEGAKIQRQACATVRKTCLGGGANSGNGFGSSLSEIAGVNSGWLNSEGCGASNLHFSYDLHETGDKLRGLAADPVSCNVPSV